ncbi:hypothetical protein O181_036429 [Austropuccinia psidii MF-1]|uniref:Uncharacterized protein n=1 Tax=Austropuccinia psidii MF-1 TaxID=1389203 RepID=A0A9Q3D4J5_9BASI|nr:hypothetical protein [Austropuccinia psidii MF-1]
MNFNKIKKFHQQSSPPSPPLTPTLQQQPSPSSNNWSNFLSPHTSNKLKLTKSSLGTLIRNRSLNFQTQSNQFNQSNPFNQSNQPSPPINHNNHNNDSVIGEDLNNFVWESNYATRRWSTEQELLEIARLYKSSMVKRTHSLPKSNQNSNQEEETLPSPQILLSSPSSFSLSSKKSQTSLSTTFSSQSSFKNSISKLLKKRPIHLKQSSQSSSSTFNTSSDYNFENDIHLNEDFKETINDDHHNKLNLNINQLPLNYHLNQLPTRSSSISQHFKSSQ